MRAKLPLVFLGLASIALVHCAKGTAFTGTGGSGGNGEGASGEGATAPTGASGQGAGNVGASSPNGGSGTTTSSTTTSDTTSSTTSDTTSSTTTTTSSTTTTTTSSTTTTTTTTTSSTTTTTTTTVTGATGCDPQQPSFVCLASEHCFPQPDGVSVCAGPVGANGAYGSCSTPANCAADLNCIDTGAGGNACCLSWCTSDADCSFFETCNFLATPVYVGATEYGVCYDGLGGC